MGFVSLEDLKAGASLPDATTVDEVWSDDDWGIVL
jgi:hypothetical protein